jgi:glycosyltransferase involved in cell wall biosynthesis
MLNACTIIARNYLPFARVLFDSFIEHHPDGQMSVVVLDDPERTTADEAFDVVHLDQVVTDREELHRLAMIYGVVELATAVKPLVLKHLLEAGRPHVIFFDPDICIFEPLDEIGSLAEEHSIVLTPHTTRPIPRDGRKPTESDLLTSGAYNLGFIGVGGDSQDFLSWWWERLRRDCLIDQERGLFIDQRWMEFAVSYFSHRILLDETLNVAYWNVYNRRLESNGSRYLIEGKPLRFFHFSGFKPEHPHLLSKHQGDKPRVLLSEEPVLRRLCNEYAERVRKAGYGSDSWEVEYGWGKLPEGTAIDDRMRRIYRQAVQEAESGIGEAPPDPFDLERSPGLLDWLNQPAEPDGPVSRYLMRIWHERTDLQIVFPEVRGEDASTFNAWAHHFGVLEESVPRDLLPPKDGRPIQTKLRSDNLAAGVNVAGYFRAELGIGEGGRLLLRVLEAAGIPVATITYGDTSSRQEHPFEAHGSDDAPYDVNIFCINADQTRNFVREIGPSILENRHTVGMWAWETEDFPSVMHEGFRFVDEVWAVSEFAAQAIRRFSPKPVYALPHPVIKPTMPSGITRSSLGIPDDRFIFLFLFDLFSVIDRKNPFGLIDAFKGAFDPGEGPLLVIKTINGHHRMLELESLKAAASEHSDVMLLDSYLSQEEKTALIALSDCYVSLHRAEGFGLTLAEAMSLGKPVIATGYSGNLEFMNEENSYLVDSRMVPIDAGHEQPYLEGSMWAEPDLNMASSLMRQVVENPTEARERGRQASLDIESGHSPAARVPFVTRRLNEIRRERPSVSRDEQRDPTPMEMLESQILQPPGTDLPPSRLGPVGAAARRLLLRAMRPYWWGRRGVDKRILEALQNEEAARKLDAEEIMATISTRVRDLLGRIERSWREEPKGSSTEALEARLSRLESQVAHVLKLVESPQRDRPN